MTVVSFCGSILRKSTRPCAFPRRAGLQVGWPFIALHFPSAISGELVEHLAGFETFDALTRRIESGRR